MRGRERRMRRMWRFAVTPKPGLGLGIGWRRELAVLIDRIACGDEPDAPRLGFVEIIAEDFDPRRLEPAIERLMGLGVRVIPHGVGLSLGSADRPDPRRIEHLAKLAERVKAPLVSEHAAFVRAGGLESGHLLPPPQTREMAEILAENIRAARSMLPVPLAIENISCLFDWPESNLGESEFLTLVLDRADAPLLLDVENVYANARNRGHPAIDRLLEMPLERTAYVHLGGGVEVDGVYHDTHTEPVPQAVVSLLRRLCEARPELAEVGVMVERDGQFPTFAATIAELSDVARAMARSGGEP